MYSNVGIFSIAKLGPTSFQIYSLRTAADGGGASVCVAFESDQQWKKRFNLNRWAGIEKERLEALGGFLAILGRFYARKQRNAISTLGSAENRDHDGDKLCPFRGLRKYLFLELNDVDGGDDDR